MVKKKNLKDQLLVQSVEATAEAETETGDVFLLLPGNGDWRSQLPPDFRQKMVNKMHGPFSGPEGLLEIKEKAEEFEEKSYTAATSQTDYLKKISLKMLAQSPIENGTQPTPGNSTQNHANPGMPSNQQNVHVLQHSRVSAPQPLQQTGGSQHHTYTLQRDMQQRLETSSSFLQQQNLMEPPQWQLFQPGQYLDGPSTSLDLTAQTSSVHGGDWQEEAYQKIRSMKEMYFAELNELYQRITSKLELHDIPQQPKNEHLEKLKFFKVMLEKLLQFLRLNKNDIQMAHRDKIAPWEKQIVNILNSNRPRKTVSSLPQGQLPQSRMHAMQQNQQSQSQISQMQSHESQLSSHMQSTMNGQASLDSTAQTGSVHGGDWQEEAYQKIRSMKELYFAELNELYQRTVSKLEQHYIPQQPQNEHLEKLKIFKAMLEKLLQFLRLNKNDIQMAHRDKIAPWEKQIVSTLNSTRPRKTVSSHPQGQLPQSRMHAMHQIQQLQCQISQMHPHESQLSSQMQSAMNGSSPQQNMVNSLQSGSGLDAAQDNAQSSLQQNGDIEEASSIFGTRGTA